MKPRTIYLGKTAWRVLNALAENNGRGFVSCGRRYAEISPGRAVIFSQTFYTIVAQQLITTRGENEPGMYRWTKRGMEAWSTGRIDAITRDGPYLDSAAGEPCSEDKPVLVSHRWAEKYRQRSSHQRLMGSM